jgi:hypothetical protein
MSLADLPDDEVIQKDLAKTKPKAPAAPKKKRTPKTEL